MDYHLKIVAACVVGIGLCVAGSIYENRKWDEFAAAHDCKLIAHKDSTTGYGITSSGKMGTIIIDASNTYRCNDGVDYTR